MNKEVVYRDSKNIQTYDEKSPVDSVGNILGGGERFFPLRKI